MFCLSLVVPCYNEAENVEAFCDAVRNVFEGESYQYEMIFVNDGSGDDTLAKLRGLFKVDPEHIVVVSFSRNFGKEAALLAGLRRSRGDMVCVIDADLQQRPEVVREMVNILLEHEEYDCVAAYQDKRKESKVLSLFKTAFYKLINRLSDTRFVTGASDFRTFRRPMVDAILRMTEYHRFSKGIFSWVGFETCYIPYDVQERHAGRTSWSPVKLIRYALEGFMSFSTFPLKISTILGMLTSLLSIVYMIVVIIQKLVFSIDIPGYPTIITLILFLGGMQLLMLGIIGEYLARVYIQGKDRPVYIEKEVLEARGNGSEDFGEDGYGEKNQNM